MVQIIDTSFDVYSDTPAGKDPDSHSATLRRYHQLLWNKPLPNGGFFHLSTAQPGAYLHHDSELGEFHLSSDSVGATYKYVKAMEPIISQIPDCEMDSFFATCSTVGAYLIFPSRRVNMKPTINGARGMNHKIRDRFDLTLECIRRHYAGVSSPLGETLERYHTFFDLFCDFRSYLEFFLLDDLLEQDGTLKFFIPFDHFETSPLPKSVNEYRLYKSNLLHFVRARNRRIETSAGSF